MKKIIVMLLSFLCIGSICTPHKIFANEIARNKNFTKLGSVVKFSVDNNVVNITYSDGSLGKITFLEPEMFRYNIEPSEEFLDVPVRSGQGLDKARITLTNDDSDRYTHPSVKVSELDNKLLIESEKVIISIDKLTSLFSITNKENSKVVLEEVTPLSFNNGAMVQTLKRLDNEQFFGGGMQNGRFNHTNKSIQIVNTNNWADGGVTSPNPFYWTTSGVGVVRHTFTPGNYDFAKKDSNKVVTTHNEKRFDAYYFVANDYSNLINEYYHLTGKPNLPKLSALYLGHLNCYNRDTWVEDNNGILFSDGKKYREYQPSQLGNRQGIKETLNGWINTGDNKTMVEGGYQFSARAVIDQHMKHDMPLGWFLPNDGYGCGFGKDSNNFDSNIQNLKEFGDYAREKGVDFGLWTQSNLWRNEKENNEILQRDIIKEVAAGLTFLKTDVAWVGYGYSFGLNGLEKAYPIMAKNNIRPDVITLDGWAGTQRYGGTWAGDQSGGNWEYIRFMIPTYIGSSLSGQPNTSSDMDGIFGGGPKIQVRDFQWKTFTAMQLDMDGWGSAPKMPYTYGEPYTSINRLYLKFRSQLMPYLYNELYRSLDGVPFNRAMFINYPSDSYAYSVNNQYQFMLGKDFLVAPIYQNTAMKDNGDDIRNNIYLPDSNQLWVDYFTGQKYRGGQVLNNFDAPFYKLPLFVRDGAIIPMYTDHNNPQAITAANPKGLDRSYRLFEFYPSNSNSYTLIEDDGKTINYESGKIPSHGSTLVTKIDSIVENNIATLTINPSSGSVNNISSERSTEFIVNLSKKPTNIAAYINNNNQNLVEVNSLDEMRKTPNSYVYVEKPNLNNFATAGSEFEKVKIETTPKLYVHIDKVNVNNSELKLVLNDFYNDSDLGKNELNSALAIPTNLKYNRDNSTAYSNDLTWDKVNEATTYDIEADGIVKTNLSQPHFVDEGLTPNSVHSYRVRSRNADGYSEWSPVLEVTTIEDPYLNVIRENVKLYHDSQDQPGEGIKKAYDNDFNSMWHTRWTKVNDQDITYLMVDLNQAYDLDKVEYYPRDNGGNGTFISANVEVSLDGKNWSLIKKVNFDRNKKNEISLNNQRARFVRFNNLKTVGGFGSANEIMVYSVAPINNHKHLLGDLNNDNKVNNGDFEFIKNYAFASKGDSYFDYVRAVNGDINYNDKFDIYDIAFIHQQVDKSLKKEVASGKIYLDWNKKNVSANEIIEVPVMAKDASNIYGYSLDLNLDYTQFSKISLDTNLNGYTYSLNEPNTKDHWTVGFIANSQNDKISGSKQIAKLVLQPKNDFDFSNLKASGIIVGTDRDETALDNILGFSEQKVYLKRDSFDVTYTNDVLTTDDGQNKDQLFQEGSIGEARLYDGDVTNLSEFKWFLDPNTFPESVKLPTDFTYNFKLPVNLEAIEIVKRKAGNGTLNKVKVQVFNNDEIILDQTIDSVPEQLVVSLDKSKVVTKVIITPLESSGVANGVSPSSNRMLSLREIGFVGEVAKDNPVQPQPTDIPLSLDKFASILFTNEKLTTDKVKDGSVLGENGYKLFKDGGNGSPEPLFDNNVDTIAEYSWAIDGTGFEDYTRVPLNIDFNLKSVYDFEKMVIIQRPQLNANGRVKSLQLVANVDGKDVVIQKLDDVVNVNEIIIKSNGSLKVSNLRLEILSTTGDNVNVNGVSDDDKTNRMLTLAEISVYAKESEKIPTKLDVSKLDELSKKFNDEVFASYNVDADNEVLKSLKQILSDAAAFISSEPIDNPENVEKRDTFMDTISKLSQLLTPIKVTDEVSEVSALYSPAIFETKVRLVVSKVSESSTQIVYDVKFVNENGKEVQPKNGLVNLSLPVLEKWTDKDKIVIEHIFNDNQKEKVNIFDLVDGRVKFIVNHLSKFVINYNESMPTPTPNPDPTPTPNPDPKPDPTPTPVPTPNPVPNREGTVIKPVLNKVLVSDLDNLSALDKANIEAAFKEANPNINLTIVFTGKQVIVNYQVFDLVDVAFVANKVLPNTGSNFGFVAVISISSILLGSLVILKIKKD